MRIDFSRHEVTGQTQIKLIAPGHEQDEITFVLRTDLVPIMTISGDVQMEVYLPAYLINECGDPSDQRHYPGLTLHRHAVPTDNRP